MKLMMYSDIHHGSAFEYGRLDSAGYNSRLIVSLSIEDWITNLIAGHMPDVFIFMGDLMERSIYSYLNDMVRERIMYRFVKFPDVKFFYMVGNHDLYFKGTVDGKYVYGDVMNPLPNVIRTASAMEYKGVKFGFLPWGTDQLQDSVDYAFLHRDILGASMGYKTMTTGIEVSNIKAHRIFTGHIHIPQKLSNNAFCIGSTYPTELGECDGKARGVWFYDTDTGSLTMEEPPFPKLTKVSVTTDNQKAIEQALEEHRGNCIIFNLITNDSSLAVWLHKNKDMLIQKYELENLEPIPTILEKDKTDMQVIKVLDQESMLKDFISRSDTEGLDPKVLFETGMQLLNAGKAKVKDADI